MDITEVLAQFEGDASPDELRAMAAGVDTYLDVVHTEAGRRDFVDVRLASRIAGVLRDLIDGADEYTTRERRLLTGAIRYFIETDDENSDFRSATGLEDDAQVLNAVCDFLGRSELRVEEP